MSHLVQYRTKVHDELAIAGAVPTIGFGHAPSWHGHAL